MLKAILGKKIGMTQIFDEDGKVIPVTAVLAGPCVVVQKKTVEQDGYESIQVGFDDLREKLINKPKAGHFKKAGVSPKRYLREFKTADVASFEEGQVIKTDVFEPGDVVDVSGVSKGKGFKGVIALGQHRGPMAHGSRYHRRPGSMGACSSPSKVMKGKRLPAHKGSKMVTIQNLEVVKVEAEKDLLLVKGAIPGARGGLVSIRKSVKA